MSFHDVRNKKGQFAKKSSRKKSSSKPPTAPVEKWILNAFLLDNSGSMREKTGATVSGFNEVLTSGRKDEVTTGVKSKELLAFFGSGYIPVNQVTELVAVRAPSATKLGDKTIYNADGGMTALWDSTHKLITAAEEALKTMPVGTKVILTIFTDGEENQSRTWRAETIKPVIEAKQKEGWVINFIGAGDDILVKKVSASIGIYAVNTMSYENTSQGTARSMTKMSQSRTAYAAAVADGTDSNIGFFGK